MKNNFFITPHHCYARPYLAPGTESAASRYVRLKRCMEQPVGPRGVRILLAWDDRLLRPLMASVLDRFGYTVIEAVDGEDALVKYRSAPERIDLLLLDMDMPKKNGREVYEEIRQTKPDIKVMFGSLYPAEVLRNRGIVGEAAHILAKPFGPQHLLMKIREVLSG